MTGEEIDSMLSAEENMDLIICEDQFFSLRYIVGFEGHFHTSLSHRCTTYNKPAYSWHWRWSVWNECHTCGIDIPVDLMRTWRMFLMLDEVEIDNDFVRNVYKPFTPEEREVLYWRKIRFI